MARSITFVAAIALAGLVSPEGVAQEAPVELWVLEDFEAPESVVYHAGRDVLYVSNIAGQPTEKNGAGFVSIVSREGEMIEARWVTGLDAPKGLALDGDSLYVTDIDRLIAIDTESGAISGTWAADGAEFLNDPAVDADGRVFASDMLANTIYMLDGDTFSIWLQDEALQHPNGLKVEDGTLVVASWGQDMQPDFSTRVPGHLITVDLETKAIAPLGSGEPVGNLDGLEPDGAGNWLVTDWIAGALLRIRPDGSFDQLLDLDMGSADLEYVASERIAVIPMMLDDRIVAYQLD